MTRTTAWVDAHVHLHACYRPADFFDAALRNLGSAARRAGAAGAGPAYLVLTESAGDDAFGALEAAAHAGGAQGMDLGAWRVQVTAERESLRVSGPNGELNLVAGRQVACREGLEVLLPGTRKTFDDRRPIRDVLAEAERLGLPRVVPWGAGKWFFARGRLLSQLVNDHKAPLLFLGDEGGRPGFWPYPRHFGEAARIGVRDLPGTDPLPFAHDIDKVGLMGAAIDLDYDAERPWASLLAALANPATGIRRFATLEGPVRFVRNQAGMQLRKHGIA